MKHELDVRDLKKEIKHNKECEFPDGLSCLLLTGLSCARSFLLIRQAGSHTCFAGLFIEKQTNSNSSRHKFTQIDKFSSQFLVL